MSEEDKKLLLEMKSNCLEDRGTSRITYNDEKRIKKAKAIDNVLNEIERLNNIINEFEKDFERKIQSCTIEAETTTNDFYCRLHIATLKKWLNKIQELKGSDKE